MGKVITECSLAELVEDPLVDRSMESEGVDRHGVELLFERVARERARDLGRSCLRDEGVTRCLTC